MAPIRYDPQYHRVVDTDFGRFLQRELRDPQLHVYYHLVAGNWVVAVWLDSGKSRMLELVVIGPSLQRDMVPIIARVRSMVRGNRAAAVRRRNRQDLMRLDERFESRDIEEMCELADVQRFLRARVRPNAIRRIRPRYVRAGQGAA